MTYVTGDVHGYFGRIGRFCAYAGTTRDDVVVVLGDACVNFWGDEADDALKRRIAGRAGAARRRRRSRSRWRS